MTVRAEHGGSLGAWWRCDEREQGRQCRYRSVVLARGKLNSETTLRIRNHLRKLRSVETERDPYRRVAEREAFRRSDESEKLIPGVRRDYMPIGIVDSWGRWRE